MAVYIALETHVEGLVVHLNVVGEDAALLAESVIEVIVVELIHEGQVGIASRIGGSSYPKYATLLCPLVLYPILDVEDVYHEGKLVACVGGAVSIGVKSTTSVKLVPMRQYSRALYIDK